MADLIGGTNISGLLTVDSNIETDEGDVILDSTNNLIDLGVLPTGAGNGLDADLLDGHHGGDYLRSNANDTYTGVLSTGEDSRFKGFALGFGHPVSNWGMTPAQDVLAFADKFGTVTVTSGTDPGSHSSWFDLQGSSDSRWQDTDTLPAVIEVDPALSSQDFAKTVVLTFNWGRYPGYIKIEAYDPDTATWGVIAERSNNTTDDVVLQVGNEKFSKLRLTLDNATANPNNEIALSKFAVMTEGRNTFDRAYLSRTGGDIHGGLNVTGTLSSSGNRALDVSDEGAGNGLDADLLDGQHASAFSASGHTHDGRYLNLSGGSMGSSNIHFQPSSAGGSVTGLTFESNNNAGSDYGHVEYHDDYFGDGTGEKSALLLRAENDNAGSSSGPDGIVLDAAGGTYIERGDLDVTNSIFEGGNRVATRTWVGNNADVPNADFADNAGDSDTLDGYHASDLNRSRSYASLSSTDTTTDINKTSWTQIPWDIQNNVDANYTHDAANTPTQITFDEAGTYQVYTSISYQNGGVSRQNPGVKFSVNGTRRDAFGLSGYTRYTNGHDEASNSLMETITVSAGDTLRVETTRMGDGGSATLRANESILEIVSLSEYVETTTDSDTVDGYHASAFLQTTGGTLTGELNANQGMRVARGGLDANNSIEAQGTDWLGLDSGASGSGVLIGYYNAPEVRIGTGSTTVNAKGTLQQNGNAVATQTWTNNNADVPQADNADTVGGESPSAFANSGHTHALGDLSNVTATGEGAGNGLDADLLDGKHESAFASSSHNHDDTYVNEGDAIPHPVYATKSDVPTLSEGESVYVSGDGLYIEDGT